MLLCWEWILGTWLVCRRDSTRERYKTGDTLRDIQAESDLPLSCWGDFNEVLRQDEHVEAGQRTQAQIRGFREAVDECSSCDLGYVGRSWTFEKKVAGGGYTRVRLDRSLATVDCRNICRLLQTMVLFCCLWTIPNTIRDELLGSSDLSLCGNQLRILNSRR